MQQNHTLCKATHDGFCVEISQTTSRLDRKQNWLHACAVGPARPGFTKVGWASRWIAFQIRFRHNRNTKSDLDRWLYRPVNCICTKKYTVHRGSCRFSAGVEASVTWHTGFSQWRPLFVASRRQIARSQNRRRMCEIRLTKLFCAAQQVGIVHFYALTHIKGLSCPLWWMPEWRNLLTSTHVGYRSVIRAIASVASLKFGVQGASATNWFSRVNGGRDNGIWL